MSDDRFTRTGRTAALDYGQRRVGVAVSDPFGTFALPVGTFSPAAVPDQLRALIRDRNVTTVVVGLPLRLSGERGPEVQAVAAWTATLQSTFPELRFVEWDERFTSVLAQRAMIDVGIKKSQRREKGRVDQLAAVILLQSYLDAGHRPTVA